LEVLVESNHPGGWEDVIAFMEEKEIFVPDARGRTLDPSDIIKKYSTGEAASMLHRSLLAHGWYVPGDEEWMKPCSEWRK
jgi:hypothetical protein